MQTIDKIEFRKAIHLPKTNNNEDTHIVSELITYTNGEQERKLRFIQNYKRPFFITKKIYRKRHTQKIEYEDIEKVERVECTESDAVNKISAKLGIRGRPNMRKLKMSPYLYWGDMRASTIIKKIYNSKLKGDFTPFNVCMLDIEADILTSEISLITVSMGTNSRTFISETWMRELIEGSPLDREKFTLDVYKAYEKDAPDVVSVIDGLVTLEDGSTYTLELEYCRHEGDVITNTMAYVHSIKPDILTAWGALYDIETMSTRAANVWGLDPKNLFSDPSVPEALRRFNIRKDDNDYKKMNSGKESFIPFQARFHIFESTSFFIIIDYMSAFYYIRNGSEPKVPGGYGIDNILNNYMKFKKLKPSISGMENLEKSIWHKRMSTSYKPEYTAYNIFDSKSMILLDNKTKDLSINMPLLLQDSEFDIFKSGPKKLLDSYTFFLLDNNKVVSTKSPLMEKFEGLGTEDWIVTLDSWKKGFDNTFSSFKGMDYIISNLRLLTTDLDIISSYPFQTLMFGLGTSRTARQLLDVEGFEKAYFVKENLGVCTGKVQALTFCSRMLNLPTVFEVDEFIKKRPDLIKLKKVNL